MLWTFPFAWLVLALPFVSILVILRVRPLRQLSAAHHRLTWTAGVIGVSAFALGLVGLLPSGWGLVGVLGGGAIAGFACLWPTRPDDGGDDWRRWSPPPNDWRPPPGLPDLPIDWQEFDRLRVRWERRPRRGSLTSR